MIIYYTHHFDNRSESHSLLRKAVRSYAEEFMPDTYCENLPAEDRLATKGEFGKPYIPGFAPFSISHSNNTWAVLICTEGSECGLDIQYERKVEALSVAKRFYAPEDAGIISDLAEKYGEDDSRVKAAFFRLWARREALVKAAGSSVAGSGIPPVNSDAAEFEGTAYLIADVMIPGSDASAAVCFMTGDSPETSSLVPMRIEYREL